MNLDTYLWPALTCGQQSDGAFSQDNTGHETDKGHTYTQSIYDVK